MRFHLFFSYLAVTSSVFFSHQLFAQNDSLILKNGNTIVGEIKNMDRGVLQIETAYSDKDFMIELDGIKKIYSSARFLLTTTDGNRYIGTFHSNNNDKIEIMDDKLGPVEVNLSDIVGVRGVDEGFLSRLYANIDFGYSLTKANNQQQFNLNFRLGYVADTWSMDSYFNSLFSSQNNVNTIRRNDAGVGYRYFLPKDWYLGSDLVLLSNTEQDLKLRTNFKLGTGKYIIHTNAAYLGVSAGAALTNETYNQVVTTDTSYVPESRLSGEAYFGSELNLYDIGDLNLFTNVLVYPSLTESGRWRVDYRFDAKYDDFLLKDLYIRAGFTLNFDNRPAVAGKEVDYIFTTGFGWEW